MIEFDDDWYEVFWDALYPFDDEDDGTSATRIIGELFAAEVIRRDGDVLVGRPNQKRTLDTSAQYLVRRIEDAAREASGGGDDG